jgi:RNA polymerase sigma-70 factor (ECF subfamily)
MTMKSNQFLGLLATLVGLNPSGSAAAISLETAPPVVVRTQPVAGSTNVDPRTSEIVVQFSKPMQDSSWSWSTWGDENFPETTGQPRYASDGRTCVLPVKLEPGKFYATWLNSEKFGNFKDRDGRSAVPYLLTFTTAGSAGGATVSQGQPDLRSAAAMVATFKGQFAAAYMALQKNDTNTALVSLRLIESQLEGFLADVRGSAIEKAIAGGVAQFLLVVQALEKGNTAQAKTLIEGLNISGPEFERMIAQAAAQNPTAAVGVPTDTEPVWTAPDDQLSWLLNDDQKTVVVWTDRQFRSYWDERTFDGWSAEEFESLEKRMIDALNGPRSRDYYTAINTLGALRSTNALPRLRELAFERVDKNNRDRWMAVRVLGLMGDRESIPNLIHLVYHGNQNTHWWAQITLVRLTGQNFADDWEAWGKWWNASGGQPLYKPEIIRWWDGQADDGKLAESLAENNRKFLESIRSK